MRRQSIWLARAATAAGLLAMSWMTGPARAQEPADPIPGPAAETRTVALLDAQRDGLVQLEARGKGDDQVRLVIRSNTPNRLNVVLPPGLVASASVGQLGGGFQSMGLGAPTDQPGAFGQFRHEVGFRSRALDARNAATDIVVPAGQTVDLTLPAVCLNFGLPTPTPKDSFTLVAVDDFTSDERARKALRSLATLGTSQKVAQAVAWNVFNDVTFPQMLSQASKKLNPHEIALAARFVDVLDMSGGADIVDPAYLREARVFVRLRAGGASGAELARIVQELESQRIFGLPLQVVENLPTANTGFASLVLDVSLSATDKTQSAARVNVQTRAIEREGWISLGNVGIQMENPSSGLDGATLANAMDREIARSLVRTKVVRRSPGRTTLAIENRLPMTISGLTLRAGQSEGVSGLVDVPGLGLGPARTTTTVIPAAHGVVEGVVFNGL